LCFASGCVFMLFFFVCFVFILIFVVKTVYIQQLPLSMSYNIVGHKKSCHILLYYIKGLVTHITVHIIHYLISHFTARLDFMLDIIFYPQQFSL